MFKNELSRSGLFALFFRRLISCINFHPLTLEPHGLKTGLVSQVLLLCPLNNLDKVLDLGIVDLFVTLDEASDVWPNHV